MATDANSMALAAQARRSYVEGLLNGLPSVVQSVDQGARVLLGQVAEPAITMRRRDVVEDLQKTSASWLSNATAMLRSARVSGMVSASRPSDLPMPSGRAAALSLVDNDTIEIEILSSRLTLAMMDRAS